LISWWVEIYREALDQGVEPWSNAASDVLLAGRAVDQLLLPDWTLAAWLRTCRSSIVFGAVADLLACLEALLDDQDIVVVRVRRCFKLPSCTHREHRQPNGAAGIAATGAVPGASPQLG
jgi:hypothetical protein